MLSVNGYAFPSGHTMSSATFALALPGHRVADSLAVAAAALAATFALLMGLSRIYLGVHWLTDVLRGMGARGGRRRGDAAASWSLPAPGDRGASRRAAHTKPVEVVFLDWGSTLMVDDGTQAGPMAAWPAGDARSTGRRRRCAACALTTASSWRPTPTTPGSATCWPRSPASASTDSSTASSARATSARASPTRSSTARPCCAPAAPACRWRRRAPSWSAIPGPTTWPAPGRPACAPCGSTRRRRARPAGAAAPDAEIRKLAELPQALARLSDVAPVAPPRRAG